MISPNSEYWTCIAAFKVRIMLDSKMKLRRWIDCYCPRGTFRKYVGGERFSSKPLYSDICELIKTDRIQNHKNWRPREDTMKIESAVLFTRALRNSMIKLVTLNLHNSNLQDKGVAIIISYVRECGSIKEVGLQQNFITDMGAFHIASTYHENREQKLKKLDLSYNFISGVGACKLLKDVAERVLLDHNVISQYDIKQLDIPDCGVQNLTSLPQVIMTCQMVNELCEHDDETSQIIVDEVYGKGTWQGFL